MVCSAFVKCSKWTKL